MFEAVLAAAKDDVTAAFTIADKQERESKLDELKDAIKLSSPSSSRVVRRRSPPPSGP